MHHGLRRVAVAWIAAAISVGATGCEGWVDRLARRTGSGFDPEGTVHAFLWARNEGRDTSRFWHTAPDQPRAQDPMVERPITWRSVRTPWSEREDWRVPGTKWRRFVVSSRGTAGREQERTWDFCLVPVMPRGELRYELLAVWPGASDTVARCAAASEPERTPAPTEPPRDPAIAAYMRQRALVLIGHDVTPQAECEMACGDKGTNRDCNLCLCLQNKIAAPACDEAAARYGPGQPKAP